MSAGLDSDKRSLVPRWLSLETSRALGLLPGGEFPGPKVEDAAALADRVHYWRANKGIVSASELLSFGFLSQDLDGKDYVEAAKYLISNDRKISHALRGLAESVLNNRSVSDVSPYYAHGQNLSAPMKIKSIRERLGDEPKNPILWSDLSHSYAIVGAKEKSIKAAKIAFSLGGAHPHIAVSSSRAMLHYGDGDAAVSMLRKSFSKNSSLFVISSEVSIVDSLGLRQKSLDKFMSLEAASKVGMFGANQASMVVASLHAVSGKVKKANAMVIKSLSVPNENCLAQAVWMSDKMGTLSVSERHASFDFEARARSDFNNSNYKSALDRCYQWLDFQPFSRFPATVGSYIAAVALMDYQSAEEIAKRGYALSYRDPMVVNNYAVSLALNDKVDSAFRVFSDLVVSRKDDRNYATYCATFGLLNYKARRIDEGRKWYEKAVHYLNAERDFKALAIALAFWAEQEGESSLSKKHIARSRELAKKSGLKELDYRFSKAGLK